MKVSKFLGIAVLSILSSQSLLGTVSATDRAGTSVGIDSPVTDKVYVNTDMISNDGNFSNTDKIESKGKFVTTDSLASDYKKATCPAPPQKKKTTPKPAPKPESVVRPGEQLITQTCSPAITINMPQGTYFRPSQGSSATPTPDASSASFTAEPPVTSATTDASAKAPESFRLNFKNLFETEFTTHSPIKLGVFMLFSLLLTIAGGYCFYSATKNSPKSKAPLLASSLGLLLLAIFVAYFVMKESAPPKFDDATIDRMYSALLAAKGASIQQHPNSKSSTLEQKLENLQAEIAQMQAQQSTTPDKTEESKEIELTHARREFNLSIILLAISSTCLLIFLYISITGRSLLTPKPFNRDLPLDDLYNLEGEISKTVAATNNWLDVPEIHLNSLLNSIDHARKFLESSRASKNLPMINSATFFIRTDQIDYPYLNDRLRKLDSFLSTRPKYPGYKWREKMFKQLTTTRKEILEVCSVRPCDEESNTK